MKITGLLHLPAASLCQAPATRPAPKGREQMSYNDTWFQVLLRRVLKLHHAGYEQRAVFPFSFTHLLMIGAFSLKSSSAVRCWSSHADLMGRCCSCQQQCVAHLLVASLPTLLQHVTKCSVSSCRAVTLAHSVRACFLCHHL